ncbi:MAG: type II toxin-antitoxin system VapC family toxin [Gemmataceae bacterium]|nr:type II toxin-antitoxin system VapC family toxin [Gemmataceae bacterium]
MTFDNIPAGLAVFLDANCLVYDATFDPTCGPACKRLLERIENKELPGYTSVVVVAEMAHRLMTIEVANRLSRPLTGIANWLRRHPAEVQQCVSHRRAIDELAAIPLIILPVHGTQVSRAADLSIQFGLLTNDALIVAVMQDNGLNALASRDPDFDRVPGITRYAPV